MKAVGRTAPRETILESTASREGQLRLPAHFAGRNQANMQTSN